MSVLGRASVSEALSGLLAAKQRSVLALIGIVIGVASVSSMISVGGIARDEAVRQFEELGTDMLKVTLRRQNRALEQVQVPIETAEGIVALPGVRASAPYTAGGAQAIVSGRKTARATLVGATEAMEELARLKVSSGRFVSTFDGTQHYCTVGAKIAAALREADTEELIGSSIGLGDIILTVVGALERSPVGERPFDPNEAIIVPIGTALRLAPQTGLREMMARMSAGTDYRDATLQLVRYFGEHAPRAMVRVQSAEELIEQMHRQMRLYTLLLGAVGSISLLVGGIGVMNVMLVAVTERRSEIGVRRALGARQRDIQAQFLVEAVILSLLGGLIGVSAGIGATYGICQYTGWQFAVSPGGTALGTVVAGGAGIFFGIYPAYQAARLNPVAALQGT